MAQIDAVEKPKENRKESRELNEKELGQTINVYVEFTQMQISTGSIGM